MKKIVMTGFMDYVNKKFGDDSKFSLSRMAVTFWPVVGNNFFENFRRILESKQNFSVA